MVIANTHEEEIIREHNLDRNKVVCFRSYQEKCMLPPKLFRHTIYDSARELMPIGSLRVDGLIFLYDSKDYIIPNSMIMEDKIWEKNNMDFLIDNFSKSHRKSQRYYVEIGANIGTSCVYMHKILGSGFDYLCFEPMSENVKLLKMNCILNDCEDIRVERLAVSNTNGNIKMYTCPGNSGGDSIEYMSKGSVCVNVPCTTLDEYFITHNIAMDSVALIWIDIEGHEAYAINGMKKILSQSSPTVHMEFNPQIYRRNGTYDMLMCDLMSCFSEFVCMESYCDGDWIMKPIKDIEKIAEEYNYKQLSIVLR